MNGYSWGSSGGDIWKDCFWFLELPASWHSRTRAEFPNCAAGGTRVVSLHLRLLALLCFMAPPLVSLPSHTEFTLPRTMEQHVASQHGWQRGVSGSFSALCLPGSLCLVQLVSPSLSSAMGSFLLDFGLVGMGVKMNLTISWSPGMCWVNASVHVCPLPQRACLLGAG